jgi:hypothetical protein
MQEQSPIFMKTEDFMKWLLQHTLKFPKHERFRLAKRLDDALFDFHYHILQATKLERTRYHLLQADVALERIRTYLRLSTELGYTKPNQLKYAFEYTVEIGNLLGGWLRSVAK